jgi:hypothetical protein
MGCLGYSVTIHPDLSKKECDISVHVIVRTQSTATALYQVSGIRPADENDEVDERRKDSKREEGATANYDITEPGTNREALNRYSTKVGWVSIVRHAKRPTSACRGESKGLIGQKY